MDNMNNISECRQILESDAYTEVFLQYTGNLQEVIEQYDFSCIQVLNNSHLIVSLGENDANPTGNILILPRCYGLMDQGALEETGVLRLRRRPFPDLYGQGVLVGIIDDGIDITNPLFISGDGTSRIFSIWNQTDTEGNTPDDILYGSEYVFENFNIRNAVEADNTESADENGIYNFSEIAEKTRGSGHGTFMAAAAVGNDSGVATQSELVIVRLREAKSQIRNYYRIPDNVPCFLETDIAMGVKYLLNVARRLRRPIVICMGLGTSQGGHNGNGVLDEWLGSLGNSSGIGIVAAAGNEGNSAGHYRGSGNNEIRMRVGTADKGFCMEIWTDVPNLYRLGIVSPGGETVDAVPERNITERTFTFLFERTTLDVIYVPNESIRGGVVIFIRFTNATDGIWRFILTDERGYGGNYDIWLPIQGFISPDTYFIQSDPDITITGPGNARNVITVAAYNYTDDSVWINSGRGYTRNGRVKPDIAAPGVNITIAQLGNRSGTSIATAYTAGCVALLLEWGIIENNNYRMNNIDIRNMLISGADRGALQYPNREWGWGMLNVFNALDVLRA